MQSAEQRSAQEDWDTWPHPKEKLLLLSAMSPVLGLAAPLLVRVQFPGSGPTFMIPALVIAALSPLGGALIALWFLDKATPGSRVHRGARRSLLLNLALSLCCFGKLGTAVWKAFL